MKIDERREKTLTNFKALKQKGKIIETDHNPLYLELNLEFSIMKPERTEFFQFKNIDSQNVFKQLTSNTNQFTSCFNDELPFEIQAENWRKLLDSFFHKAFKKVRITNRPRKKHTTLTDLMNKSNKLKMKLNLSEK
jgi:hypothetical protein